MNIPVDYFQANLRFGGVAAPQGAEVVFGGHDEITSDPLGIATLIAALWEQDMNDHLCSSLSLLEVLVKKGPNTTGPSNIFTSTATGDLPDEAVSPAVSVLVRKTTGLGGRKGRGRMFVPGASEGGINGSGEIDGTYISALQSDCDDFLTDLAAADIPMYLLHGDATAPTLVTSLDVQSVVATQRLRNRR